MKHTGYTPGPWSADQRASGDWFVRPDRWLSSVAQCGHDGDSEANARLIADAPRLAERREKLEAWVAEAFAWCGSGEAPKDRMEPTLGSDLVARARALLAAKP